MALFRENFHDLVDKTTLRNKMRLKRGFAAAKMGGKKHPK
jgi:hypothetical protein